MPWNAKCPNGGPAGFNAIATVNAANFNNAVYVDTAVNKGDPSQQTRYAYTYVNFTDGNGVIWIITVVAHIHWVSNPLPGHWLAGNTFIPGWDNFQVPTSAANLAIVQGLNNHGAFPGDDRYPRH